ncbi:MAG: YIP1 family protein [Acidobacteriaceae bacterium]|nr:YIP1 family protein [Acidobacteriaceae bacterium]MBV8571345.1 YIP1 family protein [Acidobacteriaceae bacterium]
MATFVPELPASPRPGFASDLAGMWSFLIDPAGAARRVNSKWFWVGPLVLFSIVSAVASFLLMPIVQHVLEIAPLPEGTTPEQYQKGIQMSLMVQRIFMWFMPVYAFVIFSVQAAILLGMSTVTGVKARFGQLFNLIAGCSIIQVLAALAAVTIVKVKGDISTMAELRPPLGLDIFLPEGSNKYLAGFLGYFSVFEIWWIVMIVLIFSAAFAVKKGKAFVVIVPLIIVNILFRIAGAAFQR